MQKEKKAENFLPKPIYAGGPKKMTAFIKQNLKYPEDAEEQRLEGAVRIKIDIDFKGKVTGTKILSSVSPSCDKEATRVASMLEFQVVNKLRKGKIRFHKTLNIRFKLSDIQRNAESFRIKYELTKSKKNTQVQPKKPANKTYTYTLKY